MLQNASDAKTKAHYTRSIEIEKSEYSYCTRMIEIKSCTSDIGKRI